MVIRKGVPWGIKDTECPDSCFPVQTLPPASDELEQFPSLSLSFLTFTTLKVMGACRAHEESALHGIKLSERGPENGIG